MSVQTEHGHVVAPPIEVGVSDVDAVVAAVGAVRGDGGEYGVERADDEEVEVAGFSLDAGSRRFPEDEDGGVKEVAAACCFDWGIATFEGPATALSSPTMITSSSFSTNSTSESESLSNVRSMTSCFTLSFAACSASRSACGPEPQDFASFALLSAACYEHQRQIAVKIRLRGHTKAATSLGLMPTRARPPPPSFPPPPNTWAKPLLFSAACSAFWRARCGGRSCETPRPSL